MLIVGIDPGLTGAIAFLDTETNKIHVEDVPTIVNVVNRKKKQSVDMHSLQRIMAIEPHPVTYIEQVSAMPNQGITSMFNFGQVYGMLQQAVVSNKHVLYRVTPQKWKKLLGVKADKKSARLKASELMPNAVDYWPLAKHDGRAEAALIALYGAQDQGIRVTSPTGENFFVCQE